MSTALSALSNSLGSVPNPGEIDKNKESQIESEQKASNVGINKILMMGLGIYKRDSISCGLPSVCYHRIGVGSIMSDTDNKLYILTSAYLFGSDPVEYFLLQNGQPLCPFKYQNSTGQRESEIAFVPIGQVDPETQQLHISIHKSLNRDAHFHV